MAKKAAPIAIVMGSQSDWETLKHTSDILNELDIAHDVRIVSAHRTPKRLYDFASHAADKGVKVIIAGAGGAAHLPGMVASMTTLPVLGVPVGTLAIGKAGAKNAALLAASILGLQDDDAAASLAAWRRKQTDAVAETPE